MLIGDPCDWQKGRCATLFAAPKEIPFELSPRWYQGRPRRGDVVSGQLAEQGRRSSVNPTSFPYQVRCPECGRPISAESAALMDADYWQHLEKEHGMRRRSPFHMIEDAGTEFPPTSDEGISAD